MKTVIILQRILKKYRIPFYNLLRETLLQNNIKLEVIHGRERKTEELKSDAGFLDWAIEIKNIYLPFGFVWQPCWSYLRNSDLVIVEQANMFLMSYPLMVKRLFSKQKLAFLGHGITRQRPSNSINNIFKRAIAKNVDWWFAYTQGVAEFVASQRFPREKITAFQNSIDTHTLIEAKNRVTRNELDILKEGIRLGDGPIGIFCGGMYSEKRIKFLLDACQKIKQALPDFEIIFLGAGVDDYLVRSRAKENKWIHYVGPCFGNDKIPYFMLADILLMPGLVGLVALDSFALETPIVTTTYPWHSPEVEYIQNGTNGIITEDNLDSFVEGVKLILLNRDKLNRLKIGCKTSASTYTIEKMVDNFGKGIVKCLRYEKSN